MPRNEPTVPEAPLELPELLDFPAETSPPLRDRPPFPVPEGVADRRDVEVMPARLHLSDGAVRRAVEAAGADAAVRRLLGRRFVVIGARRPVTKERRATTAVFYSYVNQWMVEAELDPGGGVAQTRALRMQPPLTDDETALVVRLARRAVGPGARGLEAGAMAVSREEPEDPLAGRRLADVRFFPADERLSRYYAVIDIADRGVVASGPLRGRDDG